jgi:hypothetical protein
VFPDAILGYNAGVYQILYMRVLAYLLKRKFYFLAISFVPEALCLIFQAEECATELPLNVRQFNVATITHGDVRGWKC